MNCMRVNFGEFHCFYIYSSFLHLYHIFILDDCDVVPNVIMVSFMGEKRGYRKIVEFILNSYQSALLEREN